MELDSSARRLPPLTLDQEVAPLVASGAPERSTVPAEPAPLTVAGRSEDGRRLLLLDAAGTEYQLPVDHRLRAAVEASTSRTGPLETPMDSVLRPRDIQARIRAGESPESVAEVAQTSVERIMPYAGPVLAEREHVAERAQRSSLRRRPGAGESAAPRVLGDAVAAHLRGQQVSPDTVTWDAWRREDGRWTLTAAFAAPTRTGTASFGFDLPGNFVVAEDDDARWLVGEAVEEPPAPRDDLQDARQRRQGAVRDLDLDQELPLGEDALDLLHEADSHAVEEYLPDTAGPLAAPADVPGDVSAADTRADTQADTAPTQADTAPTPAPEEPAARRPGKARRGRASVPSWDEIMFGGGRSE